MKLLFSKKGYSEQVIRKSLYWLSEHAEWGLSECDENWEISILKGDDAAVAALNRLLNDFLLREKIDNETLGMRKEIVKGALVGLARKAGNA